MYPEDKLKSLWDLFMTVILLITCIQTPYAIAFTTSRVDIDYFSLFIDICFLLDILVIFNRAYYNDDMDIIDDRCTITKQYLTGWFIIDIIAIIPFDYILESGQFNSLIRVARFSRLYRLVKLTRLLRVLKIFKQQNKML